MVQVEYKCRRCSKVFSSGINGTAKKVFDQLIVAIYRQPTNHLFELHTCNDGGAGVGDLIGHSSEIQE